MEQTLLLNATHEPLKVVHWQKAVTLWCQGKVEVMSVSNNREVRSVSFSSSCPSVIRLLRYIKIKRNIDYVPFSRANIYARDDLRAGPVARSFPRRSSPSIMWCRSPRAAARTGKTSSRAASAATAGRAAARPLEAGIFHLIQIPKRPERPTAIRITVGLKNAPDSWRDYFLLEHGTRRDLSLSSPSLSPASPFSRFDCMHAAPLSRITGVYPLWAVEGGSVTISGDGFQVEPDLPEVKFGGVPARVSSASQQSLTATVPAGLDGGKTAVQHGSGSR